MNSDYAEFTVTNSNICKNKTSKAEKLWKDSGLNMNTSIEHKRELKRVVSAIPAPSRMAVDRLQTMRMGDLLYMRDGSTMEFQTFHNSRVLHVCVVQQVDMAGSTAHRHQVC